MRGYQKKVIFVKNTGSRHFEEAYFIMRPDCEETGEPSETMIEEANRIIKENFQNRRGGFFYSNKWYILAFFLGCAITFALCFVFGLLI